MILQIATFHGASNEINTKYTQRVMYYTMKHDKLNNNKVKSLILGQGRR